jgi:hypothetical protein
VREVEPFRRSNRDWCDAAWAVALMGTQLSASINTLVCTGKGRGMSNKKKPAARAERLWRRVMREGRTVEEVAREQRMSPARLERILMALSKRRAHTLKMG